MNTKSREPIDGPFSSSPARGLKKAFFAVILLNSMFLVLAFYLAYLPSERIASRAQQAFETGALTNADWLVRNSERGYDQYTDCFIIQLVINDNSPLNDALAPIYLNNSSWSASCGSLKHIVLGQDIYAKGSTGHTRYWHGPVPIAATMLSVFTLEQTRKILKFFVYCSLLVLAVSALKTTSWELKIFACSIAGVAAIFWGLPYFGQSLGRAPGDIALILGLAGFLCLRDRTRRWEVLISYCASYGAVLVYLEYWTGQLPTAAGFLFVAAYLSYVTSADDEQLLGAWRFGLVSVLAFIGGGAFTIVLKQVVALLLTDAPALTSFLTELNLYINNPPGDETSDPGVWNYLKGRLIGLWFLLLNASTLTFWNRSWAAELAIVVSMVWCGAILLVVLTKSPRSRPISDLFAFGIGAATIFVWCLLFPNHTKIHASFMSRMLVVPVALGVAALLCSFLSRFLRAGILAGQRPDSHGLNERTSLRHPTLSLRGHDPTHSLSKSNGRSL